MKPYKRPTMVRAVKPVNLRVLKTLFPGRVIHAAKHIGGSKMMSLACSAVEKPPRMRCVQ